ncbi:MAG: PhnA domain-containing protein [Emcibacteraceae bacterium]|nr:PhnA domain-containing protein [Emcibacteraceae bacterium]
MAVLDDLKSRAENKCELCGSVDAIAAFEVPPSSDGSVDQSVLICSICREESDDDHFKCLADSMWTPVAAVQVMAWRHLNRLSSHTWAQELLDMLYLEDEILSWAQDFEAEEEAVKHLDSNGVLINAGDTVVLIKDLNVKGAGFTAKRGTAVRNVSLDLNNAKHIEGRVEGQHIVILTEFVKKK